MPSLTRRETLALLGSLTVGGAVNGNDDAKPNAPRPPEHDAVSVDARRIELYRLLGDLPERDRPITSRKLGEEDRDGYVLETLELDLNGIEPVPAYFARPKNANGRLPTIVFNHSHGGGYKIGKREFVDGRSYLHDVPYARALTENGWAGLAIDHWVFGERSHTSESDTFKAMLWEGRVLWGMMVYDSLRAVDYVSSRPDVAADRIGTLGISMGSTMAWWLAALDKRIRATVDICCLTEFHTLLKKRGLRYHGIYYYVPSLLKHFTTAEINELICPRPHLALAGLKDKLTPVEGLDIIDSHLRATYSRAGVPEHWRLLRYDVGHEETAEGREEIIRFFEKYL